MSRKLLVIGVVAVMFATGCATPRGKTIAEKRSYVDDMRQTTLDSVQVKNPELAAKTRSAAGYGVFSNLGLAWIIGGGGQGYGVVVDNKTGNTTYMRVVRGSLGLGIGAKEYKALIVFYDSKTLNTFVTSGWDFEGEASAVANTGNIGGNAEASGSMTSGLDVYRFTDRGLYVRAAVEGAKCYPDRKLNAG
jgi:lipid-binding SYLF domain-containing protein